VLYCLFLRNQKSADSGRVSEVNLLPRGQVLPPEVSGVSRLLRYVNISCLSISHKSQICPHSIEVILLLPITGIHSQFGSTFYPWLEPIQIQTELSSLRKTIEWEAGHIPDLYALSVPKLLDIWFHFYRRRVSMMINVDSRLHMVNFTIFADRFPFLLGWNIWFL